MDQDDDDCSSTRNNKTSLKDFDAQVREALRISGVPIRAFWSDLWDPSEQG